MPPYLLFKTVPKILLQFNLFTKVKLSEENRPSASRTRTPGFRTNFLKNILFMLFAISRLPAL